MHIYYIIIDDRTSKESNIYDDGLNKYYINIM